MGAFENYTDIEINKYFSQKFLNKMNELSKRCIFLKDVTTGTYIGTCCAWMEKKEKEVVQPSSYRLKFIVILAFISQSRMLMELRKMNLMMD